MKQKTFIAVLILSACIGFILSGAEWAVGILPGFKIAIGSFFLKTIILVLVQVLAYQLSLNARKYLDNLNK